MICGAPRARVLLILIVASWTTGCRHGTGEFAPEQRRRAEAEGIVREATDLSFRYGHDLGSDRSG